MTLVDKHFLRDTIWEKAFIRTNTSSFKPVANEKPNTEANQGRRSEASKNKAYQKAAIETPHFRFHAAAFLLSNFFLFSPSSLDCWLDFSALTFFAMLNFTTGWNNNKRNPRYLILQSFNCERENNTEEREESSKNDTKDNQKANWLWHNSTHEKVTWPQRQKKDKHSTGHIFFSFSKKVSKQRVFTHLPQNSIQCKLLVLNCLTTTTICKVKILALPLGSNMIFLSASILYLILVFSKDTILHHFVLYCFSLWW